MATAVGCTAMRRSVALVHCWEMSDSQGHVGVAQNGTYALASVDDLDRGAPLANDLCVGRSCADGLGLAG